MKRHASSMTYRLRIKGQLVQVQIAPGIYRGMEKQAAVAGKRVEEVIREYLEPVIPERQERRAAVRTS